MLNAETGNNVINVDSTLAATPVTVNGNAGNDSLIIASAGGDWDLSILGNVTFRVGRTPTRSESTTPATMRAPTPIP